MKTRVVAVGLLAFAGACTGTTGESSSSSSSSSTGGVGSSSGFVVSSRASSTGGASGGTSAAGTSTAGTSAAGTSTAGTSAAATSNAGTSNAGTSNAGTSNAGTSNAGTSNAGTSAAGTSNAGTSTAGTSNAGTSTGGGSSVAGTSSSVGGASSTGGGSSSGAVGCGNVTAAGECVGGVLNYCRPDMTLATQNCATWLNNNVQQCGLINASWGNDCYSAAGAGCFVNDGTNIYQIPCLPGGACALADNGAGVITECRANYPACTPPAGGAAFVPVCLSGTELAVDCPVFGQTHFYDCVSFGATGCNNGLCVGIPAGRICDPLTQCAAGLACLDDGTGVGRCTSAGLTGTAAITALRAAVDGAVDIAVTGVTVSYVKPLVGTDVAGFFLQNDPTGPAIFVAVDPATLAPVPVAGDTVSFTATAVVTLTGQKRVTTLTGFARTAQGATVTAQDVSAAVDLVTGLDGYDSELLTVTGVVVGSFGAAGTGHLSAGLNTAGVTGNALLKVRMPTALVSSSGARDGCTVTITRTPLWRFNTQVQVSAWNASEVQVSGCPAAVTNAVLVINEVNANIAGGCDLLELRVLVGGPLNGVSLHERSPVVATFPSINVAKNDLIVVHFNNVSAACAPVGSATETLSISESTTPTSYATAWDVYIADTGLTATDNTLWVTDSGGAVQDAVLLADLVTGTAAADSETAAETVRLAGQWTLPDGTTPVAGFYVDGAFRANAVLDLNATGTTAVGSSIQRTTNVDSNNSNGWTIDAGAASTFGALNAGQSAYP